MVRSRAALAAVLVGVAALAAPAGAGAQDYVGSTAQYEPFELFLHSKTRASLYLGTKAHCLGGTLTTRFDTSNERPITSSSGGRYTFDGDFRFDPGLHRHGVDHAIGHLHMTGRVKGDGTSGHVRSVTRLYDGDDFLIGTCRSPKISFFASIDYVN